MQLLLVFLSNLDDHIVPKEVSWTDSSSSDISSNLFAEELELDLLPNVEDENPFARHGPMVEPDFEDLATQRDFWSRCLVPKIS